MDLLSNHDDDLDSSQGLMVFESLRCSVVTANLHGVWLIKSNTVCNQSQYPPGNGVSYIC